MNIDTQAIREEEIDARLTSLLVRARERATAVIEGHMKKVATAWQKRFPKREVEFVDYLAIGFVVSASCGGYFYVHDLVEGPNGERYARILAPLIQAERWYIKIADRIGVDVNFTLPAIRPTEINPDRSSVSRRHRKR